MDTMYLIFGSTEMGEKEVFAVYNDRERANTMLSRLEGRHVREFDEFWIERFELNRDFHIAS